jgi:SRSO17 transposase
MLILFQERLAEKIVGPNPDPDAMITVDGSGFPKKGTESVGVARQYCGRLGKTDNCQEGVFIGYTSSNGYSLLKGRLYMPQKWFDADYADRREKCGVPDALVFKTQPAIASELIQEIISSGRFPARWIGVDSGFGSNHDFLDSLPDAMLYFADIHKNATFFTSMPEVAVPPYKGKGKMPTVPKPSFPPVAADFISADPNLKWENTYLGEGAKGPIYSDTVCLRVFENRDGLPGKAVWLYMRRLSDGSLKFTVSNAPADMPKKALDAQAIKRWPIEQSFEECKSQLGMDHCESRSWNSWHRHILLVLVASLFILALRVIFKKKQPILTLAQTQRLIVAAFNGAVDVIEKALKLVSYYLRRNYSAYLSHKKHVDALVT